MSQPIMKIISVQDCLMTALKFRRRKFAQIGSLKQFFDGRMRFSRKMQILNFGLIFLGLHLQQRVLLGFIGKLDVDFSKLLLKIPYSNRSDSAIKTVFAVKGFFPSNLG
jgi:hypothetical protein